MEFGMSVDVKVKHGFLPWHDILYSLCAPCSSTLVKKALGQVEEPRSTGGWGRFRITLQISNVGEVKYTLAPTPKCHSILTSGSPFSY